MCATYVGMGCFLLTACPPLPNTEAQQRRPRREPAASGEPGSRRPSAPAAGSAYSSLVGTTYSQEEDDSGTVPDSIRHHGHPTDLLAKAAAAGGPVREIRIRVQKEFDESRPVRRGEDQTPLRHGLLGHPGVVAVMNVNPV